MLIIVEEYGIVRGNRMKKGILIAFAKMTDKDINKELQWLGYSLGLFNLRDKDRSCFRIFIELLKAAKQNKLLSSDELAHKMHISRGTVVHHLHKLMDSGIVIYTERKYGLRVDKLEQLIVELQSDLKKTTDDLKQVAVDIDKWLG